MWCISEFTRDNGPLRVIPGSHLASEPPIDTEHGYGTGMGPHPDEVKIIAPAGSLIMFNAPDLWHSGTFNYSPAARLALTAGFGYGPPWRPPSGDVVSTELSMPKDHDFERLGARQDGPLRRTASLPTAVGYGGNLEAGAARYWVASADAKRSRLPRIGRT